jgi:hypothetical protein
MTKDNIKKLIRLRTELALLKSFNKKIEMVLNCGLEIQDLNGDTYNRINKIEDIIDN